jgi:hypothetical protein
MKMNHKAYATESIPPIHIGKRNAYHQAGLAVAVYLGNRQKNLPALHFQIAVSAPDLQSAIAGQSMRKPGKFAAKMQGGRLMPFLPDSFEVAIRLLSAAEQDQCLLAFEADVINLLAGSLAEAKYVAQRDGEAFNANLVYLGALKFYGGGQELEIINEYLACLLPDNKTEQRKKLAELFLAAYSFINDRKHWQAIQFLGEAIYDNPKEVFTCEELIALIEQGNSPTKAAPQKNRFDNVFDSLVH